MFYCRFKPPTPHKPTTIVAHGSSLLSQNLPIIFIVFLVTLLCFGLNKLQFLTSLNSLFSSQEIKQHISCLFQTKSTDPCPMNS